MPERVLIYHNPRCSKSRQALALLEERGMTPEVVLYLQAAPTEEQVLELIATLGTPPHAILRTGEEAYAELGLGPNSSAREVAEAISSHPILLERPIVVVGDKAVVGRPPERVLSLL